MMPRPEGGPEDPFEAARARSRARRAAQRARREQGRKRLAIAGGAATVAAIAGVAMGAGGGGSSEGPSIATGAAAKPIELPGGGRTLFPGHRIVALYGTSGSSALGDLGRGTPRAAAHRLRAKLRYYRLPGGPKVLPAFEFIGTVAARSPGADGAYRTFRPAGDVRRYLRAVRAIGGIFVIDVQPGRADFFDEVKRYRSLLEEPDVSLALDPEWKMGPDDIPGQVIGHTDAATINRVSAWLAGIVHRKHLPQKLLLVHQFTDGMVQSRAQVLPRPGVAVTFNVDGFGTPAVKRERFHALKARPPFFTGFKLFLTQDIDRLKPAAVLRFHPRVLFVDYQ